MERKPLLIFDLDGTLWDSGANVATSWNLVIQSPFWAEHLPGKSFTEKDIHSVMGRTMKDIADILFGELDKDMRPVLMKECEEAELDYISKHGGILYPLVRETLLELKQAGYTLAIVSNCQCGYIEAFLDSMDMRTLFADFEEWGRTRLLKEDNIKLVCERNSFSAGDALYIGDIQKDCDSAHAAGVGFVHAAYGFGTAEAPEFVINEFSQLKKILKTKWQA